MIVFIALITGSVCIYLEPCFADNLSIRRDFHFRGIHDWVNDVGAVINFICIVGTQFSVVKIEYLIGENTLIRERVASMYELTYVYNLDEMLKLYDLIMMQRDIEYSRSQKERGGE